MKKNIANYLYFLAGILFAITAIIGFARGDKSYGFLYICLTITFISRGFRYKKLK